MYFLKESKSIVAKWQPKRTKKLAFFENFSISYFPIILASPCLLSVIKLIFPTYCLTFIPWNNHFMKTQIVPIEYESSFRKNFNLLYYYEGRGNEEWGMMRKKGFLLWCSCPLFDHKWEWKKPLNKVLWQVADTLFRQKITELKFFDWFKKTW